MTYPYEPLSSGDESPRPSRLRSHVEWLREQGAKYIIALLNLLFSGEFWACVGFLIGAVLVGGFIIFWAWAFFGGMWSAFTYDAAAGEKAALEKEAERGAVFLKSLVEEIKLLRESVDRLAASSVGQGREL